MNTPFTSASLYVGDLTSNVTESDLFDIFNRVGPVALIRVCRDSVRRSLCYAYVNYHNSTDAERALEILNNTLINGKPCRIMWSQRDPTLRKTGVGNVFIKNLHKSIDPKQLSDIFSEYGNILSCKIATDSQNISKGHGFVHFETQEMADKAIQGVNGKEIAGLHVFVGPFIPQKERIGDTFTNVFVKNLDENMGEDKLKEIFEPFGTLTSAVIMTDNEGKSKCFGFVNFASHESAAAAIKALNQRYVTTGGKTLFVGKAQKKAERDAELKQKFEQEYASKKKPEAQGVNLFIKNLDEEIDDEKLKNEFSRFGNIVSVKVIRDEKGQSKGFGFVCFRTYGEANRALLEMRGKQLGNKMIYISAAHNKENISRPSGRQNSSYGAPSQQPYSHFKQQIPRGARPYQQQQQQNHSQITNYGGNPSIQQRQQARSIPRRGGGFRHNGGNKENQPQSQTATAATTTTTTQQTPTSTQSSESPVTEVKDSTTPPIVETEKNIEKDTNQEPISDLSNSVDKSSDSKTTTGETSPTSSTEKKDQSTRDKLSGLLKEAPQEHHQGIVGEHLYHFIEKIEPKHAAKITGMLLDGYPIDQLVDLLDNPSDLQQKITEAVSLIESREQNAETANSAE